MVKSKKFLMLILQLVLMGIFVIGTYSLSQKELKLTTAYVYTKKLNANAEVDASDMRKVQIPNSAVSKGFLTEKEYEKMKDEIKQNGVSKVVTARVEPGQYVYSDQISDTEKIDPFEKIDLSKYRKVSIPVTYETSASGEVKRGDTVDLAYVGSVNGSSSNGGVYTNIFMQNVLVYSVTTEEGFEYVQHSQIKKSQSESGVAVEEDDNSTSTDYGEPIAMVTLAVPINQVEEIIARQNSGEIVIIGRFEGSIDSDAPGYYIGDNNANSIYSGNKQFED